MWIVENQFKRLRGSGLRVHRAEVGKSAFYTEFTGSSARSSSCGKACTGRLWKRGSIVMRIDVCRDVPDDL